MGSINSYINTISDGSSSSLAAALGANDAGNAQLTADDGGMAGHTAAISYNSLSLLHSGNPVRSCHFGYQDFALLEFVDMGGIQNYMYTACNVTRAGRQAFNNNLAVCSHFFRLFRCAIFFIAAAPYGFRAGLQDVNLVVALVNAPFHVHVAAIMCFNFLGTFCQLLDLRVSQLLLILLLKRNHNLLAVAVSLADELNVLRIDVLFDNSAAGFIHSIVIRSYSALYNVFTQAPSTLNEDVLVIACCNVYGEHNACCFREHHHLYCSAQRNIQMVKALLFTVVNSTVGKAGGIALLNLGNDGSSTLDVQVSVLLSGKAGIWQILGSSAAAYSHKRVGLAHLFAQLFVGLSNLLLQIQRHFLVHNCLTHLSANLTQLGAVIYVQAGNQILNLLVETCLLKEILVGAGGSCKAIRNRYINMACQLTQRGRFAACNSHILSF